jgi:hypothetical protein
MIVYSDNRIPRIKYLIYSYIVIERRREEDEKKMRRREEEEKKREVDEEKTKNVKTHPTPHTPHPTPTKFQPERLSESWWNKLHT